MVTGAGDPAAQFGEITLPLSMAFTTEARVTNVSVSMPLVMGFSVSGAKPSSALYPSMLLDVAFPSQPLATSPAWTDLSPRIRVFSTQRGRSYEFNRMETGTLAAAVSNRDAALSPANSASPYAPLKSTRPVQLRLVYDGTTYPVFRGISEGYPQAYPGDGTDALVQQSANDLFYALNQSRFTPGSTTLGTEMEIVAAGAEETITVGSTGLPMPQAVPFEIIIDADTVAEETVTVTEIVTATSYVITRAATPQEHAISAPITTHAVSFAEELSGTRIQRVLEHVGFTGPTEGHSGWYDLDAGQSVIAASEDLAGVSPLEHINLVAETEFGRFFASRAGLFTFRDRHSIILDFLTPIVTFADLTLVTGTEIPYRIEGALEHSEEKLYNRVRITVPSGEVVDISDQTSIDEHFERVYERELPYANLNDAVSAANFVLARSVEHTLRLPRITVFPASDPTNLWPAVLAREIGDRCRFRYQPEGGGDEIDQDVIIEGISHTSAPRSHAVGFQLVEADPNDYWILGTATYSELGETTWAAF